MQKIIERINKKEYIYKGLITYLCLVIFAPYISIGGRDNFEITFPVTLALGLFIPFAFRRFKNQNNKTLAVVWFILLGVLVLDTVSILNYIRVTGGIENIISNIIPNIKVFLYLLAVSVFFVLEMDDFNYRSFLYVVIPIIAFVSAAIGIFQRFNFLNFNEWFTRYYITGEGGEALLELLRNKHSWSRIVGTLSNPNFYSLQLLVFSVLIISNIIYRNEKKVKTLNILILIILMAALVLTQSRTALIVLICIFLYIMIIHIVKGGLKNLIKYLIAGCIITLLFIGMIKLLNLDYFFEALRRGITTNSITVRIERWKEAIELFKLHPVIGIGPVIGKYFSAVDNEYIHILRNYGILGLIGHMSFYVVIFVLTFKDMFSSNATVLTRQYAFAVNSSIAVVLISNITLATFYHWRNFILLLVISCIWAKSRNYRKNYK